MNSENTMHIKEDSNKAKVAHVNKRNPAHDSETMKCEKLKCKEEHVMPVHQDAATGDGLGPRQDELGHLEKMAKE